MGTLLSEFLSFFANSRIARKLCGITASFCTSNFSISLWERPKAHHVHDFRILGRVHATPNRYYMKKQFGKILVWKMPFFWESNILKSLRKAGAKNRETPSDECMKISNTGSISPRKHEMEIK